MSTVNNPQSNSPDLIELQALIAANLVQQVKNIEKNGDPKAALAHLTQTIEEVLEQLNPTAGKTPNSKIVHPNFKAPAAPSNPTSGGAPSNAQMQQSIGELMALLTTLEGEIAKYGNENAQSNAGVGQSLINEMSAQVKQANDELQKVLKEESHSSFWSIFTKVAEAVVGAILCTVAILLGQPELAVIILVFTVLAVSGGMDKITEGLSDVISKALIAAGVPKSTADTVAKVLADVIVIVASIIITAMTCGAGAAAVADEVVEDGIEMTDMAANDSEQVANSTESTVENTVENTESFTQKLQNFFSKAGNWIKENNPFNKLPRNWNLGLVAGAQAVGSTNFGADFMSAVLINMKDNKTKQLLEQIMGTIIDLLAALAGAGAGASVCAGPAVFQINNVATPLKVLLGLEAAAGATQAAGETGQGVTYTELASAVNEQGETQALLSELQALVNMNGKQSSSDSKALSAKMKTWATELSALSTNLNLAGAAVAKELQA